MRYISKDKVDLELPDEWKSVVNTSWNYVRKKAVAAWKKARLQNLPLDDQRLAYMKAIKSAINTKGVDTWQYIAPILGNISFQKCWYCECLQTRSDMAVDHYRPKNEVEEDSLHPGYWWLAFEWSNYRYSCTFCNSKRAKNTSTVGGKQCRFPVQGYRSKKRCQPTTNEQPLLLDPFIRTDTRLLTFATNGLPQPADMDKNSNGYKKASVSIQVYHLDERGINQERKSLCMKIRNLVTAISENENEQLKNELLDLARPEAEYSSAARIYIRQYRPNHPWILELLEDL
ncbi:MAG: hypothetical protein ACSHX6_09385 [Akkermansiaceae bacterium]